LLFLMEQEINMRIGLLIIGITFLGVLLSACNPEPNHDKSVISEQVVDSAEYKVGDTVAPLRNYDFTKGSWEAEIVISKDDNMDLSDEVPRASVLRTSNVELLELIKNWKFVYTEGDIATVVNKFKLIKDDTVMASFGIILDKNTVGLQSQQYGWMPTVDSNYIFKIIKQFDY